MRRWLRAAGAAVIVAAIVAGFAARYASLARRHGLEAEIALLKAEGGSTRAVDLAPKPVGNREGPAYTVLKAEDFTDVFPWRGADGQTAEEAARAAAMKKVYKDFYGWYDHEAARYAAAKTPSLQPAPPAWSDEWVPTLEEYVAANARPIAAAGKAALEEQVVFYVDWRDSPNAMLPHLGKARALARVLAIDALLKGRAGDTGAALDDLWVILRLRRPFDEDPAYISKLVAYAIDDIALVELSRLMERRDLDRKGLAKILAELADREKLNRRTSVLLGETAQGVEMFEAVRRDPKARQQLAGGVALAVGVRSSRGPAPSGITVLLGQLRAWLANVFRIRWSLDTDERYYLRRMRGFRAASRLPLPQALAPLPPVSAPPDTLSSVMVPSFMNGARSELRADTSVAFARAAIALYLYRADNGSYPQTLDALTPGYLPQAQIDPFDGKPIKYKPTEKGYVMYSIGADCVDNGGTMPADIAWEKE